MSEAEDRARSAWDARFKHVKAANTWLAVAHESPARREVSEILANWMTAYADADAAAERAFSELAVRQVSTPQPQCKQFLPSGRPDECSQCHGPYLSHPGTSRSDR